MSTGADTGGDAGYASPHDT